MSDRINLGQGPFSDIVAQIKRAYYDSVYRITKAALEPVVAATSDVIKEVVTEAVRDGVKDAFSSTDFIVDLLFGRWKKK